MSRRWSNGCSTVGKDILHVVCVGVAIRGCVVEGTGSFPQHNTTERRRVLVHVLIDQRCHALRANIETRAGLNFFGRQTNVQFGIGVSAGLDDAYPIIKVETGIAVDIVGSRTVPIVVELNPEVIKGCLLDSVAKECIRQGTQWCGAQKPFPRSRRLRNVLIVKLLETVCHVIITCCG